MGTNLTTKQPTGGNRKPLLVGLKIGRVCPSVCPSDWDKQKTLVANNCLAATCDERFKMKRRGQEWPRPILRKFRQHHDFALKALLHINLMGSDCYCLLPVVTGCGGANPGQIRDKFSPGRTRRLHYGPIDTLPILLPVLVRDLVTVWFPC